MKRIIVTVFAAMCSMFASAQTVNEFSFNGGVSLSAFDFRLPTGASSLNFSGEFGVGYTRFFSEKVGIHIGANLALYNSNSNFNGVKIVSKNLIDNEGDRFDMHTTLDRYEETHNAKFLNIPVMAQFETGQTNKFYFMGGVKIGIPLNAEYKVFDATITNKAYYPDYDNWLIEQNFAGYGNFEDISSQEELDYTISAALALETGLKWCVGSKIVLYTGVYFDYGLNNIAKNDGKSFVNYNNSEPSEFTVNSATVYSTNRTNVMAVGIKLRVGIN